LRDRRPISLERAPQNFKPIVGEAATALEAWLNELFRAKITQGAILREVCS